MIQNLIFGILFLKILFRACIFFIFASTFQWTSSEVFLNFRFSSRNSQSQQKLAKKITHFTIKFRAKNLSYFMNLNSVDIENNMHPQHSQQPFWLFQQTCFGFVSEKNLHCTISWRARTVFMKHFESKCQHVSVYFRKKILVPETQQDWENVWIISLRRLAVWA